MKEITDLEIVYSGTKNLAENLPEEIKSNCLEFWRELSSDRDNTKEYIERRMTEYVKSFYIYLPHKKVYQLKLTT